eukprot:4062841-Pyramimonas_sp.AAC.1
MATRWPEQGWRSMSPTSSTKPMSSSASSASPPGAGSGTMRTRGALAGRSCRRIAVGLGGSSTAMAS